MRTPTLQPSSCQTCAHEIPTRPERAQVPSRPQLTEPGSQLSHEMNMLSFVAIVIQCLIHAFCFMVVKQLYTWMFDSTLFKLFTRMKVNTGSEDTLGQGGPHMWQTLPGGSGSFAPSSMMDSPLVSQSLAGAAAQQQNIDQPFAVWHHWLACCHGVLVLCPEPGISRDQHRGVRTP